MGQVHWEIVSEMDRVISGLFEICMGGDLYRVCLAIANIIVHTHIIKHRTGGAHLRIIPGKLHVYKYIIVSDIFGFGQRGFTPYSNAILGPRNSAA